ncbi:MAG: DUF262 domain-containing protein [Lachnospiraceae bacterium]|nr:DUF262 domain-containing protein [Lachnospiraceae bacterium]
MMADIIGTIVNINDFLCCEEKQVTIKGKDESTAFILSKNRKYNIPAFQREIRWSKENLNILIQDIKSSNKFLGNVILSKKDSVNFDIIDGQQRISVLLMILHYLKVFWGDKIEEAKKFNACKLTIDSFGAYEKLQDKEYDSTALSADELETDKYNQASRYKELWDSLKEIKELQNRNDARDLFTNIKRCTINVILADKDTTNYNIDYFIDVNLKGVRLDVEDIFKGYLFHMNNSSDTLNIWVAVKQAAMRYNAAANGIIKAKADYEIYPLVKMLYHYFYSDLYLDNRFAGVSFGADFYLKDNCKSEDKIFYKGEHIIKLINDDSYMNQSLIYLKKIVEIFSEIIYGGEPSPEFVEHFVREGDKKVDLDTIAIIKGLAKLLLLDKDITLPYALIMKYFLEIVKADKKIDHDYAEQFYSIYAFSVLFSFFATKKEIPEIESVLQGADWHEKLFEKINKYFGSGKILERSAVLQCKYILDDDNEVNKHKCKSLAILYNYFKFTAGKVVKIKGTSNDIKEYLLDKDNFSVEHLIINEGKGCSLQNIEVPYEYPKDIKKYSNSIFNYIFIPDRLNGSTLKDLYVNDKLNILSNNLGDIKCGYSKMIVKTLIGGFDDLPLDNEKKSIDVVKVNEYFGYKFKRQFFNVSNTIIQNIINHISEKF